MATYANSNVADTFTISWYVPTGTPAPWLGAGNVVAGTTIAAMSPVPHFATDVSTNDIFQYVIPFPCQLTECTMTGKAANNSDILRMHVRRGAETYPLRTRIAFAAGAEQISNYINMTVTGTTLINFVRYRGVPQVAGSAATGFVHTSTSDGKYSLSTPTVWNAGDSVFVGAVCADARRTAERFRGGQGGAAGVGHVIKLRVFASLGNGENH